MNCCKGFLPLVFMLASHGFADLTTALIGKWSFDTGAADASPMGNHGIFKGAASNTDGTNRKALFCSTNGSYVDCGNGTNTSLTNQATAAAWVYDLGGLTSGGRHSVITHYNNSSGFAFDLVDAAGNPRFIMAGASHTATSYTLPLNTWVHLCATYDGGTIAIYTNGYLVSSAAVANVNITNQGNLLIGARSDSGPGNFMNGRIDEAYLYSRALTASEVLDLRNVSAFPIVYTNIFMYGKVSTSLGAPLAGVLAWVSNAVGTTAGAYSLVDGTFTLPVEQFTNVWVTLKPPAGTRIPVTATNFITPPTNFAMDFSVAGTTENNTFNTPGFYTPILGDLQVQVFKTNSASERVTVHFIPAAANARFRVADTVLSGKVNILTLNGAALARTLTTGTYIVEMKVIPEGRTEDDGRNFIQRKLIVIGR